MCTALPTAKTGTMIESNQLLTKNNFVMKADTSDSTWVYCVVFSGLWRVPSLTHKCKQDQLFPFRSREIYVYMDIVVSAFFYLNKNTLISSPEIKFTQERICECVATSAAPPREDL